MDKAEGKFDREELEAWLRQQPKEVSVAIAARCALRLLPYVAGAGDRSVDHTVIVLAVFRANAFAFCYGFVSKNAKKNLLTIGGRVAQTAANSSTASANPVSFAPVSASHVSLAAASATNTCLTATSSTQDDSFTETSTLAGSLATNVATYAAAGTTSAVSVLRKDWRAVIGGQPVEALVRAPLWSADPMPSNFSENWTTLGSDLLSRDEDWDVWTNWYEDRLAGNPPEDEALAVARVTLPEPMWEAGPKLVNAEIKNLIALNARGGAEAVEARMAELRAKYGEDEASKNTVSSAEMQRATDALNDPPEDYPAGDDRGEADIHPGALKPEETATDKRGKSKKLLTPRLAPDREAPDYDALPRAWFLQYVPGDRVEAWTGDATAGSQLRWKTGKSLPDAMRSGDPVLYWRAGNPKSKNDRGGLVGTGHVVVTEVKPERGIHRFHTEVHEFTEPDRIERVDAVLRAGISRKNWRGAVLDIPPEEAVRLDMLLRQRNWAPIFTDSQLLSAGFIPPMILDDSRGDFLNQETSKSEGEVRVRRDDAERDADALGRGPLAVSLATILHEIWCTEQGVKPYKKRAPQKDTAGFVAHIDAPWGGGKTSFANLIARVLNSDLDGPGSPPAFLRELFPDRHDMSGLFIKDTVAPFRLRDGTGPYKWDRKGRHPWIVVPFNAWLNQHMEPPWWTFYQTIRKTCFSAIYREGVPTVVQKDDGFYQTLRENWLIRLDRLRCLWQRELWWRLTTPKVRDAFYTLLGVIFVSLLLRTFGLFDLKTLQSIFTATEKQLPAPTLITTGVMVLLGGASTVWSLIAATTQSLLPGTPEAAKNYSLGSSDPFDRFREHFAQMMETVERPVLVIVDDIDRCDPKFIVEMTRGLQTILKSPRVVYLLLGDKNWIEQAFEICHKDMKGIDVGPEHSFGGRFVEKAIQLSFILPGIGSKLDDYVSTVLIGRAVQEVPVAGDASSKSITGEEAQASHSSAPEEQDQLAPSASAAGKPTEAGLHLEPDMLREINSSISKGQSLEEIDRLAAQTERDMRRRLPRANQRGVAQAIRNAVILQRTARRQEVEEAIRHRLQPLSQYLPRNPRHIKRIINAVSMYQNSLVAFEEDQTKTIVGGKRWRQLVIGVVLMIGYPKSWCQLAKNPDWADLLMEQHPSYPGPQTEGGTDGSPDVEAFAKLASNVIFTALLKETSLRNEKDAPVSTAIDKEAVEWLNRIIPSV